jgi:ceramide glucosyltransferase
MRRVVEVRVMGVGVLQGVSFAAITGYVLWTALMHLCTWHYFAGRRHENSGRTYQPTVSIIKPTRGVDQFGDANFRSFCHQDYGGDYELVFCVEGSSDPAIAAIRRLMAEQPGTRIRLVVSDPTDPRSFGKLKNMIAGVAATSSEVIVFSDSDSRVPPSFLRDTVAPVGDRAVGIAFGAPAYAGSQDWPAALTSLSVNELTLRIATLHVFGLFKGAIGTTMVVRREVMERVGGLEQLGWQIADDIQLARIIHRHGYRIHLLRQPARVVHHHDSFRGWWAHAHRWLVLVRRYWPVHFVLMNIVDLALWWSLLHLGVGLLLGRNLSVSLVLLCVVLLTAAVSAAILNLTFAGNRSLWRHIWVVWLLEILRLPLLLYSGLTNEVEWRSRKLRVNRDGTTRIVESGTGSWQHTPRT